MARLHAKILLAVGFFQTFSSGCKLIIMSPGLKGQSTSELEDVCTSGRRQSPINIDTDDTVIIKAKPLIINNSWRIVPIYTDVTNNGKTVLVQITNNNAQNIYGGILGGRNYTFQQLHLHWGSNHSGSEHSINSMKYAMEEHLVFYNMNAKNPLTDKNGILVIAQFYEESLVDNPLLEYILNPVTSGDLLPGDTIRQEGGLPLHAHLPDVGSFGQFWSYKGSLTTPPCTENVQWLVSPKSRTVSANQLRRFRKIRDFQGNLIERNHRDTQPLNGRKVKLVKF